MGKSFSKIYKKNFLARSMKITYMFGLIGKYIILKFKLYNIPLKPTTGGPNKACQSFLYRSLIGLDDSVV